MTSDSLGRTISIIRESILSFVFPKTWAHFKNVVPNARVSTVHAEWTLVRPIMIWVARCATALQHCTTIHCRPNCQKPGHTIGKCDKSYRQFSFWGSGSLKEWARREWGLLVRSVTAVLRRRFWCQCFNVVYKEKSMLWLKIWRPSLFTSNNFLFPGTRYALEFVGDTNTNRRAQGSISREAQSRDKAHGLLRTDTEPCRTGDFVWYVTPHVLCCSCDSFSCMCKVCYKQHMVSVFVPMACIVSSAWL